MQPTALQWIEHLSLQSRAQGHGHLDLLVDATALQCPVWSAREMLAQPLAECQLLAATPEHALASQGPILVRLNWADPHHRAWVTQLFTAHHQNPCYLVIGSRWPLENLATHLAYFTQAQWEGGQQSGIFRFYDPVLFGAVVEQLHPWQAKLLHAGIVHWQWRDRDGVVRQVHGLDQPLANSVLPDTALALDAYQMAAFAAWSQAQRWYRQRLLGSGDYGITAREALVHHVWMAHMAAQRDKTVALQLDAYVETWLAQHSEYCIRTGRV